MERCEVCGGSRVKISGMSVRRMFMIRCLRRGCGATTVKDLGISAALAGVIINPPHSAPNAGARGRGMPDPDDF